jgi:hypothetical protein
MNMEKIKPILLCLYVFPFSCWAFDVITTFYSINILHLAEEMNPLGWPFGALGALAFYIPSMTFTYLLLFRLKNRLSPIVAIVETLLAFGFGVMNLFAGLHNISLVETYSQGFSLIPYAELFNNIFVQILLWTAFFASMFFGAREILARILRNFNPKN